MFKTSDVYLCLVENIKKKKNVLNEAFLCIKFSKSINQSFFLFNNYRYSDTNGTLKETTCSLTTMQSLNYMVVALRHVFKHLKIHELLAASRVCTAWNIIAMNRILVNII